MTARGLPPGPATQGYIGREVNPRPYTEPRHRAALRRGWLVEFVLGRGLVGAYLACGYLGAEVIFGADGGAGYASECVDLAYVG